MAATKSTSKNLLISPLERGFTNILGFFQFKNIYF